MSVIISNTTPINYLVLIDHIAVLYQLYTRVTIPQAVFGEVQEAETPAKVRAWVASHPAWLEVRTVAIPCDAALAFLDAGEREAIRLATELEADGPHHRRTRGSRGGATSRDTSDWDAAGAL